MRDHAVVHDHGPPGIAQRLLDLLLDHDHGDSESSTHFLERAEQFLADQRGQALQRFVEEQESRLPEQGSRHRQHLLFSA